MIVLYLKDIKDWLKTFNVAEHYYIVKLANVIMLRNIITLASLTINRTSHWVFISEKQVIRQESAMVI